MMAMSNSSSSGSAVVSPNASAISMSVGAVSTVGSPVNCSTTTGRAGSSRPRSSMHAGGRRRLTQSWKPIGMWLRLKLSRSSWLRRSTGIADDPHRLEAAAPGERPVLEGLGDGSMELFVARLAPDEAGTCRCCPRPTRRTRALARSKSPQLTITPRRAAGWMLPDRTPSRPDPSGSSRRTPPAPGRRRLVVGQSVEVLDGVGAGSSTATTSRSRRRSACGARRPPRQACGCLRHQHEYRSFEIDRGSLMGGLPRSAAYTPKLRAWRRRRAGNPRASGDRPAVRGAVQVAKHRPSQAGSRSTGDLDATARGRHVRGE